jgi:hypothetical protein
MKPYIVKFLFGSTTVHKTWKGFTLIYLFI